MLIRSKANAMPWPRVLMSTALFLALFGPAGHALAQEPAAGGKIYAVVHVDVLPPNTPAGTKLLQQYVLDSRKDKGAVRIEAYVQIGRENHFSVVEVWQSQQAFDAHEAAGHTRKFREAIQPMLGSPFDERLHQILE